MDITPLGEVREAVRGQLDSARLGGRVVREIIIVNIRTSLTYAEEDAHDNNITMSDSVRDFLINRQNNNFPLLFFKVTSASNPAAL
jgi:hypothetical protein